MIRIAAKTPPFFAVPVVGIALASTVDLGPTAAEMLVGLTRNIIELPCDVLRGFQRFSLDRLDPAYDESPWLLSPTLEAL
jgi:hypothetical protein